MKNILLSLAALLLISCVSYAQKRKPFLEVGFKDSLQSKILKEQRDYFVWLPPSYDETYRQPKRYPVLYILDGYIHFHSITGMLHALSTGVNGTYVIPEMIVVAIPNTDRTRDLTPTKSLLGPNNTEMEFLRSSGGNDNFLKFMKDELIPKIEKDFRTFPYRVLVGHSFGGIAAVNALYTMPEQFNAYIAIDPSMWWDNKLLVKKAGHYFSTANLKGRSLYVAQANTMWAKDTAANAHFEGIREFATAIETRNRSGLRWAYKYYDKDGHSPIAFESEYDGLRFIFEKYNANFSAISSPAEMKALYQALSDETNVKFLPPEEVTQQYAQVAMMRKYKDDALIYLQMNIDNYPKSQSALNDMGNYWTELGDSKKALGYYQQVLKINPKDESANRRVKEITEQMKGKK